MIASWMAEVVGTTPAARLCAVASRNKASAETFAAGHGAERAFDSWKEMLDWEGFDAVYIATPTSLREEIAVAAANAGKHVLGEKPFASLLSLARITAACRASEVGFMDATHFVHHPRCTVTRQIVAQNPGGPLSLDSRFLISLTDRSNIRYNPGLEPLGALGDLGWYNMRAILEYLTPEARPHNVSTRLRKDRKTGAIVAAEGSVAFDDGSESTWQCSFDASSVDIGLELSAPLGALRMSNFIGEDDNHSASYSWMGNTGPDTEERLVHVPSTQSGAALMFEDFAAMVRDITMREQWMQASERNQALLDTVLAAAET